MWGTVVKEGEGYVWNHRDMKGAILTMAATVVLSYGWNVHQSGVTFNLSVVLAQTT